MPKRVLRVLDGRRPVVRHELLGRRNDMLMCGGVRLYPPRQFSQVVALIPIELAVFFKR